MRPVVAARAVVTFLPALRNHFGQSKNGTYFITLAGKRTAMTAVRVFWFVGKFVLPLMYAFMQKNVFDEPLGAQCRPGVDHDGIRTPNDT